jgi:hypothetical protein
MILVGAAPYPDYVTLHGQWFFWLVAIVGFVFTLFVIALFLLELENMLACGRASWPTVVSVKFLPRVC